MDEMKVDNDCSRFARGKRFHVLLKRRRRQAWLVGFEREAAAELCKRVSTDRTFDFVEGQQPVHVWFGGGKHMYVRD